jgi:hypothetical protein
MLRVVRTGVEAATVSPQKGRQCRNSGGLYGTAAVVVNGPAICRGRRALVFLLMIPVAWRWPIGLAASPDRDRPWRLHDRRDLRSAARHQDALGDGVRGAFFCCRDGCARTLTMHANLAAIGLFTRFDETTVAPHHGGMTVTRMIPTRPCWQHR